MLHASIRLLFYGVNAGCASCRISSLQSLHCYRRLFTLGTRAQPPASSALGRRSLLRSLGSPILAAHPLSAAQASAASVLPSGLSRHVQHVWASLSAAGHKAFSSGAPLAISGSAALATFAAMGIWAWLAVDVAIQWGGWAISALLKTEKLYDMLGVGSFAVLSAGSLALAAAKAPRKILVTCMVGVWSLRLGSYLVARVHKVGKDSRFDEVKHQPGMFFIYWSMQALWVWITLSPVLVINTAAAAVPLKWWDCAGVALWALGFALEAVADAQKDAWRARPENKGKFITEGLWSVSRHPNYFGEMLVWWGMWLTCVTGFTQPAQYATIASPICVMLLLRYVSGVPVLERQAKARWGGQPEYEAYKASTPLLVPDLTRLFRSSSATAQASGAPSSSQPSGKRDQ